MEVIYNQRHLGLFSRHLVTIRDDCFYYKGERYTHEDIEIIRVGAGSGQPQQMGIKLRNGKRILISAVALERNGVKGKTGFISGTNQLFEELREYFEKSHT